MRKMLWEEVVNRVEVDDQGKWDTQQPIAGLRMNREGRLSARGVLEPPQGVEVSQERGLLMTDFGFGQLCGRLEIPAKYVKRLPPELRADCVNHDLARVGSTRVVKVDGKDVPQSKDFLLRCKGDAVRAVLSDKYSVINNRELVDTFNSLAKDFQHQVRDFYLDERGVWMKILVNDLRGWDPSHKGNELHMGLLVGNSEVGGRAVTVEPFVYRYACTNDMVVQIDSAVKIHHIHIRSAELRLRCAESMNAALKAGDEVLDRFVKSYEESVERPVDVIAALAAKRGLSQERTDAVKLAFAAEPFENKFGVVNAFTAAARAMDGDDRVDMERFAGSLLGVNLNKVPLLEEPKAATA